VHAFLLVTGILALGVGLGSDRFYDPPPDDVREILANPDRIESFSIHPTLEASTYEDAPGVISGHRVLKQGRTARGRRAQRFVDLFLDEDNYRISGVGDYKECEFLPRHALRFVRGERSTVVLLCLECAQVQFENGGGDLDPVARELEARVRNLVEKEESEEDRRREEEREKDYEAERSRESESPQSPESSAGQK
jgi:hypothetical protein